MDIFHSRNGTIALFLFFLLISSSLASQANADEVLVIHYPKAESEQDQRSRYPVELLQLALQKSAQKFQLQPTKFSMQQGRALKYLEDGAEIDVFWSMTSKEREQALRPIRIPIDKGLLGWRLLLIKKENAAKFQQLESAEDFKRLIAGQGHDWPDTEILKAGGFTVRTSATYEGLFEMLTAERFDFFPRSSLEIWEEVKSHAEINLQIAPRWVLHYPTASYYFVNKTNVGLAKAIESGLEVAIKDGSFEKLFQAQYAADIKLAEIPHRRVVELNNPLLPAETPLQRKELWYQP